MNNPLVQAANSDVPIATSPFIALHNYFTDPKVRAAATLKLLNAETSPTIAEQQRDELLATVSAQDSDLKRTLALTISGYSSTSSKTAGVLIGIAGAIVHREMNLIGEWVVQPQLNAGEIFAEVCERLREGLLAKGREKRSKNLLLIALLWLAHSRQLDVRDALLTVADTLTKSGKEDGLKRRLVRIVTKFIATKPGDFRKFVELAQLWGFETRGLQSRLNSTEHELQRLRRAFDEAVETGNTLQAAVDSLEQQKTELASQITKLLKDADEKDTSQHHSARQLRARYRGFLETLSSRQLADIQSAMELDPVRTEIIRERSKIIATNIERELQWLKSLD